MRALVLGALSPVTLFVYVSTDDYDLAIVWNGMAFLIGTSAGQVTLNRHYRALIAQNPRHDDEDAQDRPWPTQLSGDSQHGIALGKEHPVRQQQDRA